MEGLLEVICLIVAGVLCGDGSICSSWVGVRGSGQDPDEFLAEQAKEVVLAVLEHSPVSVVRVNDREVSSVEYVEAD